jgi:hypothetical protein
VKAPKATGWPLLFLAVGLAIAHHPIVFSGFRHMESNLYDGRFFNYVLEHDWRWLTGAPHHASLWSPPFFFPAPGAGAWSEILLGAAPPYFLARAIGFEMDTAYQCWILSLGVLNFAAVAALARRVMGISWLAAAAAGALFAFAGPRLAEAGWGHYQVHAQVWTVLALLACAIASDARSARRRRLAAALVAPCLALQLWSSVYMGWFVALALPFVAVVVLSRFEVRAALRSGLFAPLLGGAVCGALLLVPLVARYASAADSMGLRSYGEMQIPAWQFWLYQGDANVLYRSLAAHPLFAGFPPGGGGLGLGPLTSALALAGFWLGRRRPWLVALGCGGLALFLLTTRFGDFTLWRWVFEWVPGAGAIRAVTRAALVVLIPVALAVGVGLERVRAASPVLAGSLGLFCLAEQAMTLPSFDKAANRAAIEQIASRVDPRECDAFLYVAIGSAFLPWKYSIDAMWASLRSGVPTINGYTGFHPDGWNLGNSVLSSPGDEARIEAELARWVERSRLVPERICQVRLRPRGETGRAG